MSKQLKATLTELSKDPKVLYTGLTVLSSAALALGKLYFRGSTCKITKDLKGKVIVVTGASSGIGAESARNFAQLGATVVLAAPDESKTLAVVQKIKKETENDNIEFIPLDLADLDSVTQFVQTFKEKHRNLDVLINNAGFSHPKRLTTKQGYEKQLGVNYIGHFLLTHLLLDILKNSGAARIINVSSLAHMVVKDINYDDLQAEKKYESMTAYAQSKLASILHAVALQKHLDQQGAAVKIVALHPGIVRTKVNRNYTQGALMNIAITSVYPLWWYFSKSANEGSQTTLFCALEDFDKLKGGAYYSDCAVKQTSAAGNDVAKAEKLYNYTLNLLKSQIEKAE